MAGALGAQISAGAAFVKIFTDNRQFKRGLAQARKDLIAFKTFASSPLQAVAANPGAFAKSAQATISQWTNKMRSFSGALQSTASTMLTLGATMGAPLAYGLKTFAQFDREMRLIEKITGSTAQQMDRLRIAANKVNEMRPATLGEVSAGMLSLGRMGFSADEIEKSILPVVNLDIATGTDNLGASAAIAAAAMRSFQLPAEEMARITDILTAGANGSAQELMDLGEALKYASATASMAKEDLGEVVAMTGILANLGIKGSMAGTAIRNVFVRMADPKHQQTLRNIGVETVDQTTGNLRPMADVMLDYYKATIQMSNPEQLALTNEIFGVRGMLGGAGLSKSPEALEEMINNVRNSNGLASETADYMMQGPMGNFQQLLGTLETMFNKLGESLAPIANKYMEAIIEKVKYLAEVWIPANKDVIDSFAELVAGILKIGAALAGAALSAKGLVIALMAGKVVVPILANMSTAVMMLIAKMKGLSVATAGGAVAAQALKAAFTGWAGIIGLAVTGVWMGISYLVNRSKEAAREAYEETLKMQQKIDSGLDEQKSKIDELIDAWRELAKLRAQQNINGMLRDEDFEKANQLAEKFNALAKELNVPINVEVEGMAVAKDRSGASAGLISLPEKSDIDKVRNAHRAELEKKQLLLEEKFTKQLIVEYETNGKLRRYIDPRRIVSPSHSPATPKLYRENSYAGTFGDMNKPNGKKETEAPKSAIYRLSPELLKRARKNPEDEMFSSDILSIVDEMDRLKEEIAGLNEEFSNAQRELKSLYENTFNLAGYQGQFRDKLNEDRESWRRGMAESLLDRQLSLTRQSDPEAYTAKLEEVAYTFGDAVRLAMEEYNKAVNGITGPLDDESKKQFDEMRKNIMDAQGKYDKYFSLFLDARAATQNAEKQFYGSFNLRALKAQISGRNSPDEKTAQYTGDTAKTCQSIYDLLSRIYLAATGGNTGGVYYGY